MAASGSSRLISERAVNELVDLSCETKVPKFKRSCLAKLHVMIYEMEAMDDHLVVFDSLECLKERAALESKEVMSVAVRSPENTPLANRTSTSANPDPVISPAFVEANYEVLESLLRDQRRQTCNEDLHSELDYYSEESDKERAMEPRLNSRMPQIRDVAGQGCEQGRKGMRWQEAFRMKSRRWQKSSMYSLSVPLNSYPFYTQPINPLLNAPIYPNYGPTGLFADSAGYVTPIVHWIKDYPLPNGLKMHSQQRNSQPTEPEVITRRALTDSTKVSLGTTAKARRRVRIGDKSTGHTWIVAAHVRSSMSIISLNERCPLEHLGWTPKSNSLVSQESILVLSERTAFQKMGIIVSIIHVAIKFYTLHGIGNVLLTFKPNKVKEGQKKVKEAIPEATKNVAHLFKERLQDLLRSNANIFAWTYADMRGIPITIMVGGKPFNMEHKLNEYKHFKPVKQKKRGLAPE
ncbi:hypothetical protein Tco_0800137 [Tanacetum coccineum]|uniref:Uncharacterized protein n=1 Tax=Tanacetum coccineum TaxID=301880 RepID=A0ABQ4ZSA5_9ASTR